MPRQIVSSDDVVTDTRFPTTDPAGNVHLLGSAVLVTRYYDLTGTRFANPDSSYTGFGADGVYYTAGVATPGHDPSPATWSSEVAGVDRGTQDRFPDRILVVGTDQEVCLFDADSLAVWMRFRVQSAAGTNGRFLGRRTRNFTQLDFDTDAGVLYVLAGDSLRIADFRLDRMAVCTDTGSVVTEEPGPGSVVGSIRFRNTDNVMDAAGAGNGVAMDPAWDLLDDPLCVAVGTKILGGRQTLAVGCHRGLQVQASGLGTVTPARRIDHVGPAAGGAIAEGNAPTDEILDDDGDPTGNEFQATYDFASQGIASGMDLQVETGAGIQRPVPILTVANDQLGLLRETAVGVPVHWEVLARVRALWTDRDGTLGVVAGGRLIHAPESWFNGMAPTTLLNPSTTLALADLPQSAAEVHSVLRRGNEYLLATNLGVFRSMLSADGGELSSPELLYTTPAAPASPEPVYRILETPAEVRGLATDPETNLVALAQSELPPVDSAVPPATADTSYAFGVAPGQDFEVDVGLGTITVNLQGTLTEQATVDALEYGIPGSKWTILGAGRLRVESLVSATTSIGAGSANPTLGFTDNSSATAPSGRVTVVDPSIHQVRQSEVVPAAVVTSMTGSDSAVAQFVLTPRPAPGTLDISEPGGQSIYDDGVGGLVGDVDPNYTSNLDYDTGELSLRFLATPTGNVQVQYQPGGIAHAVAGLRNSAGPPDTAL